MRLEEAVEIARECGLETYGEAYRNIVVHAMNLFAYPSIPEEIQELERELEALGADWEGMKI